MIVKNYAAPIEPSMTEFTFGDGFIHGISWFILLILKWFGASICVFADFHTWGYVIGFIFGVVCSLGLIFGNLLGFMFDDLTA